MFSLVCMRSGIYFQSQDFFPLYKLFFLFSPFLFLFLQYLFPLYFLFFFFFTVRSCFPPSRCRCFLIFSPTSCLFLPFPPSLVIWLLSFFNFQHILFFCRSPFAVSCFFFVRSLIFSEFCSCYLPLVKFLPCIDYLFLYKSFLFSFLAPLPLSA